MRRVLQTHRGRFRTHTMSTSAREMWRLAASREAILVNEWSGYIHLIEPDYFPEVLGQYQKRFGAVHLTEVWELASPNRF